jgi:hypothetical protein
VRAYNPFPAELSSGQGLGLGLGCRLGSSGLAGWLAGWLGSWLAFEGGVEGTRVSSFYWSDSDRIENRERSEYIYIPIQNLFLPVFGFGICCGGCVTRLMRLL